MKYRMNITPVDDAPVSRYISIIWQMLKCVKWVVPQEQHTEIMYTKVVTHTFIAFQLKQPLELQIYFKYRL